MTNTSATGGYLAPEPTPAPLEDQELDDFLQAVVAAITGLAGALVRPRFQETTPNLPAASVTWAAVGVSSDRRPDTFAVEEHDAEGSGSDTLIRHEEVDVLCAFYGPLAGACATRLRDGLMVSQNREVLLAAGMGLVGADGPRRVPEMIKARWVERQDITVTIRREVRRQYPVLNLLTAAGEIVSPAGEIPINVTA